MEWIFNWISTQSTSMIRNRIRNTLNYFRRKYDKLFHGNCLVLLYHRVTELDYDPQLLSVTPDHFDKHLNYLRQHYRVLTIQEFAHHLQNQIRFPKNAVLITFDDGYADNFLEAVPLLEKYNMQALFYVATGTLGTSNEYWWDAIERIVLRNTIQPNVKKFILHEHQYDLRNLTNEKRKTLYENLLPVLRRMSSSAREEKISELARIFQSEKGRASHRAMTFEELKQMHGSKAAVIGAHTHLHPSLAAIDYASQREEISTSKRILEEELGNEIKHFSYPFGTILDYNADTLRVVRELKFDLVAANYPEAVTRVSNPLAFPRFLVRDWDETTFAFQMKSFAK